MLSIAHAAMLFFVNYLTFGMGNPHNDIKQSWHSEVKVNRWLNRSGLQCTLTPRPEEEEKGPGFSCLRMHLRNCRRYYMLHCPWICYNSIQRVKKLTLLYLSSHRIEAINKKCKLLWSQLTRRKGYLLAKQSQVITSIAFPPVLFFPWDLSDKQHKAVG